MQIPTLAACFAALLATAPLAHAFTLELGKLEPSGDQFFGCGLMIEGTNILVAVGPPEGASGIGVFGGFSDLLIDGNENVLFEFLNGPATSVRYTVSAIAVAGGATIEAYDAAMDLIGSVEVSGLGEKNVSQLFGQVPLGAFRVTNSIGGHRIGSVTFQPPGGQVTVDMRDATDTQTPSLKYCGVGVGSDGTGDLYVDSSTGIGVGGISAGVLNYFVEVGESLVAEFDTGVSDLSFAYDTSGAAVPEIEVTGFAFDGTTLGTTTVESAGSVDVSALFLGLPLTGFALTPLAGDLSLLGVTFVPEPDAGAAGLAVWLGLGWKRSRRSSRGNAARR
jgi:hypothetical protein